MLDLDLSLDANNKLQWRKYSQCLVFEFHQHYCLLVSVAAEIGYSDNDNIRATEVAASLRGFVQLVLRRQIEFVTAAAPNSCYFVAVLIFGILSRHRPSYFPQLLDLN